MKASLPILAGMLALVTLLCPTASVAQSPYSPEVNERIRQVEQSLAGQIKVEGVRSVWPIQERMDFHGVNAVSVAVINNYKLEWAKAYGWMDKDTKKPATAQTLFQAASISKSLNGVGVLKLVQQGKLNLSKDINTYLKSWKFPYDSLSKGKKITLTNLLSHTAGLSVHGFPGYQKGTPLPTTVQILDGATPANTKPVRSQFEPGLKFQYSGGGTTVSQLIVMDVTGQPYDKYMKDNVLTPLGMTASLFSQPPPPDRIDLATGYLGNGKMIEGNYVIHPEAAAAGLWTNPTDLSNYIIETQLALAGKSSKVLSQATTQTRVTPFPNTEAALGVFVSQRGDQKFFMHGGSNQGFESIYMGSLENGNGVVVMINSNNRGIIDEVVNSVATVYNWKGFYNPTIKKVATVPDNTLASYVGTYQIAPEFSLIITKEGSALKVEPTGQGKFDLYAETPNKFFLTVVDAQLEFISGTDGKVEKLILHQNGRKMDGKKIQ